MTCTCFQWQSTGIPCSHAISAILMHKENPQVYTQAFLSLEAYHNIYSNTIHSSHADKIDHQANNAMFAYMQMQSDDHCNKEDKIVPPHAARQSGRSRVRRIKSGVEGPFVVKRAKRCSRCDGLGHAVTTCDASI